MQCLHASPWQRDVTQEVWLDSLLLLLLLLHCRLLPFLPENRRIVEFHARANEM
jgi:hypothetical protein